MAVHFVTYTATFGDKYVGSLDQAGSPPDDEQRLRCCGEACGLYCACRPFLGLIMLDAVSHWWLHVSRVPCGSGGFGEVRKKTRAVTGELLPVRT